MTTLILEEWQLVLLGILRRFVPDGAEKEKTEEALLQEIETAVDLGELPLLLNVTVDPVAYMTEVHI